MYLASDRVHVHWKSPFHNIWMHIRTPKKVQCRISYLKPAHRKRTLQKICLYVWYSHRWLFCSCIDIVELFHKIFTRIHVRRKRTFDIWSYTRSQKTYLVQHMRVCTSTDNLPYTTSDRMHRKRILYIWSYTHTRNPYSTQHMTRYTSEANVLCTTSDSIHLHRKPTLQNMWSYSRI